MKAALASGEGEKKAETKKRAIPRKAAGQTWEDPTLAEWPDSMTLTYHWLQPWFLDLKHRHLTS